MMAPIHSVIKELLKDVESPVIFEVGARHGEDSQILIDTFPDGNFHVFEPLPSNFDILYDNLCVRKNEQIIKDGRLNLWKIALSDQTGTEQFYPSTDDQGFNGSSSLLKPTAHLEHFPHVRFGEPISVVTETLDYYCYDGEGELGHIDFIYMDTQGAEAKIIAGGQKMLRHTKYLYSEYYQTEMYEGQKTLDEWQKLLPGNWQMIMKWPNDALFVNKDYGL
jgi:2-O-methyltransferase